VWFTSRAPADYKDLHPHDHHDEDSGHHSHNHSHGAIDPGILDTQQGIAAIKWSLLVLLVTALMQLGVVFVSNSTALLADAIQRA
jgi:Co/Zn/Cd efflux system component